MSFIDNLRLHLQDFETEVSDEIHKFIDFLDSRTGDPKPAVVNPPQPATVPVPLNTFTAPVVATGGVFTCVAPVAPAAEPDAPVAEASPADAPAVSADAGSNDAGEAPAAEVLPDSTPAVADEPAVVEPPKES